MKKKKSYVPDCRAQRIYEIPPSFFASRGIVAVLSDLDNTLATYDEGLPSQECLDYVAALKKEGIAFYIASNNTGKRVKAFAKALGVESCHALFKPLAYFLKRFLRKKGLAPERCVLIGDQCATDVKSGNKAGLFTILVEHLSKKRPLLTKINGLLDAKYRKIISSRGLSPDWRNL